MRAAHCISRRRRIKSISFSSKLCTRLRPASFAAWQALSAAESTEATSAFSAEMGTTPMLAPSRNVRTALEQYPELIAAQARQGIAPADFGFEQRPDLTQQGIAGAVPAGVVDDLELIQIETAQGIRGFVRLGALQGAFHAVLEFTAIHQSGEHVVTRVIAQTPVQLARFAHIMEHQHAARHRAAAVANGRCRAFDIDFVAVAANQQHRPHRLDGARAADGDRQRIFQRFARFLVECAEDLLDRPALAILETPSGERLGDRVQIVDHALGVGGDDAVADALQSDLRTLLLTEQRFLVELALGDIEFDADQPQ